MNDEALNMAIRTVFEQFPMASDGKAVVRIMWAYFKETGENVPPKTVLKSWTEYKRTHGQNCKNN